MENPYVVLGTGSVKLLGRRRDWARLMRNLEKPTPDHLSVVGPRHIGKTVLLKAIGEHFNSGSKFFGGSAYCDMRHEPVEDDRSFYVSLARHLVASVERVNPEASALLAESNGGTYETLRVVFETLAEENKKILIIVDGLDAVLLADRITKNLWDNLRGLAELSSFRFVTGSRRRLRELCASPESKTSDFWNIFDDPPLILGAFDTNDCDEIVRPLADRDIVFSHGARTELVNWSGGVPILTIAVCRRIWERTSESKSLSNEEINGLAAELLDDAQDHIQSLWEDCSEEERGDLAALAEGSQVQSSEIPRPRIISLVQRGYIQERDNEAKLSCRLMERFARERGGRSTGLRRLFSSSEDFERNIQGLLELRFAQLDTVDSEMRDFLTLAIQNLDKPHIVVNPIRGLVNRALHLIWEKELPSRDIPDNWVRSWQHSGMREPPTGRLPAEPRRQCHILQLMVDPRNDVKTRVSRKAYLLLDHLQQVGNFGQHLEGENVGRGFGAAVSLAAIELIRQLSTDLGIAAVTN